MSTIILPRDRFIEIFGDTGMVMDSDEKTNNGDLQHLEVIRERNNFLIPLFYFSGKYN